MRACMCMCMCACMCVLEETMEGPNVPVPGASHRCVLGIGQLSNTCTVCAHVHVGVKNRYVSHTCTPMECKCVNMCSWPWELTTYSIVHVLCG